MAKQNSINSSSGSLTIDPGASGDSFVQFDINTTGEFRIGVDDTDDSFRISQGSALGTNDTLIITAAGEITMPLQPAFLSILTSTITNVTGNATNYTVVWDTEIFDQGSDFSSTIFTAPVTGYYKIDTSLLLGDLAAGNTNSEINIKTSNRNFKCGTMNIGLLRDATNNTAPLYNTALCDMDAADIVESRMFVTGGTKIVDINSNGATDPQSWFSGNLEV